MQILETRAGDTTARLGIRYPDGGYPVDIRDVTDGIGKLRKSYNKRKYLHLLKSLQWFDIKHKK